MQTSTPSRNDLQGSLHTFGSLLSYLHMCFRSWAEGACCWRSHLCTNARAQCPLLSASQAFAGRWVVEPVAPGVAGGPSLATQLRYEIAVVPHLSIPSALVAHVVRCGLPANLIAIARRAEEV